MAPVSLPFAAAVYLGAKIHHDQRTLVGRHFAFLYGLGADLCDARPGDRNGVGAATAEKSTWWEA
jgi:hypothetical protein